LRTIVGRRHVLTDPERTRRYVRASDSERGRRWPSFGQATSSSSGSVLKVCAAANEIVIMQAANIGLRAARHWTAAIIIARLSS
jgi:D-lactate dehydrogenase (quinone)